MRPPTSNPEASPSGSIFTAGDYPDQNFLPSLAAQDGNELSAQLLNEFESDCKGS
jgi:hypothetical protein